MGKFETVLDREDIQVIVRQERDCVRQDVAAPKRGVAIAFEMTPSEASDLAAALTRAARSLVGVLVASVIVFGLSSSAEACGRCGLFGRACKFAHHAPAVAVAVPVVAAPELLVVNNVYPPANGGAALLAQQGGTVYGYQAAVQPLRVDPAETLRQAAELAKGAQRLAETGLNGYNTSASLALQLQAGTDDTLAKGVAASAVLSAAGLSPASQQLNAPQSLRISRGPDGRWAVEQLDAGQIAGKLEAKAGANRQQVTGSLIDQHCASCHGSEKSQPAGGLYLFSGSRLSCEQAQAATLAVVSGKMPKGQQLPDSVRLELIKEIGSMVGE